MTQMILDYLLKLIFVISLCLILFLWIIPILSYNSGIWMIFQKNVPLDDVKSYDNLIIEFFRNGSKLDFLNEDEFSHMKDVRSLITTVNTIFMFSFIGLVAGLYYFRSEKRFLIATIRNMSTAVLITTLVFSIILVINFQASFNVFHEIFFVENFIFPSDSMLKILYPDGFFFGLGIFYLLSILIVSFIVVAVSYRLKLK